MVTICLQCGDKGFSNAFVYCVKCLEFAVHRYCLDEMPRTFDEFVYWVCDNCEVKIPNELTIRKSDAISVENANCTSSRHLKASSEAKSDVSPLIAQTELRRRKSRFSQKHVEIHSGIDLVEHIRLGNDSLGAKMSKMKECNPTSMIDKEDEQRLVSSSSEQSHEAHTGIDCNEQTQLANLSPLPVELSKGEVNSSLAKMERRRSKPRISKQPCEENTQLSTVADCSGTIEKTSISSFDDDHEKKPKLGKDKRLTSKTRTSLYGGASQSLKDELPRHFTNGGQERAQPVIDPIWRGGFNIWNKEYETLDGLVAHLSVKACQKVFDEATLFPPLLHLEMLPKSDIWPKSFQTSNPTYDNIALYFFPLDTRCEGDFDLLVDEMIGDELAMRAIVTNAELLIFTSTELPLLYWRFQGKYYLWGVFRAKQDSSSHQTVPNDQIESAAHPTPENNLDQITQAKTWDAESPLSPLNYSASLGSGTS